MTAAIKPLQDTILSSISVLPTSRYCSWTQMALLMWQEGGMVKTHWVGKAMLVVPQFHMGQLWECEVSLCRSFFSAFCSSCWGSLCSKDDVQLTHARNVHSASVINSLCTHTLITGFRRQLHSGLRWLWGYLCSGVGDCNVWVTRHVGCLNTEHVHSVMVEMKVFRQSQNLHSLCSDAPWPSVGAWHDETHCGCAALVVFNQLTPCFVAGVICKKHTVFFFKLTRCIHCCHAKYAMSEIWTACRVMCCTGFLYS